MKANALKRENLNNGIYLIEGSDRYWQRYAADFFISLVPEEFKPFNLRIIDNLKSFSEIVEAINTISMFMDSPLVTIIKDKDFKEAKDAKELDYILSQQIDGFLIFSDVNFLTPAQKKKLTVINADKLAPYELRPLVDQLFKIGGIEPRASDLLIEYTQSDMDRITNEAAKLKAYTLSKRPVSFSDVENLVTNTVENDIFEFTEAIACQNKLKAVNILKKFEARGIAFSYILGALTGLYRRMLYTQISNKSDSELASDLKVKEYAIKKTRQLSQKYGKKRLKDSLDSLVEAEMLFKSGQAPEQLAFRSAVSKLLI